MTWNPWTKLKRVKFKSIFWLMNQQINKNCAITCLQLKTHNLLGNISAFSTYESTHRGCDGQGLTIWQLVCHVELLNFIMHFWLQSHARSQKWAEVPNWESTFLRSCPVFEKFCLKITEFKKTVLANFDVVERGISAVFIFCRHFQFTRHF